MLCWGYGVPNIATNDELVKILVADLSLSAGDLFVDMGCGDGMVLEWVQNAFPHAVCTWYEYAPVAYKKAIARKKKNKWKYFLKKRNLFDADVSCADVVFCFLMPHLMSKVWKKVKSECKPGALLYVNAFAIPHVASLKKISMIAKNGVEKVIFVYRVGDAGMF